MLVDQTIVITFLLLLFKVKMCLKVHVSHFELQSRHMTRGPNFYRSLIFLRVKNVCSCNVKGPAIYNLTLYAFYKLKKSNQVQGKDISYVLLLLLELQCSELSI